MIENKIVGFVVNKVNYKDNDAIFNVLTCSGKETFKARGILKINSKNASSCNFFMISEFIVQSKTENSNKTLKMASKVKYYHKPYEDILVSSVYLAICSLLDQVNQQVNGYDLAIKCFNLLENESNPIDVLNYFLKYLCEGLGYKPNIKGCINCGSKDNLVSFDFETGGFICANCLDTNRFERYSIDLLEEIYNFLKSDDIIKLKKIKALKILEMYNNFIKNEVMLNTNALEFVFKCI